MNLKVISVAFSFTAIIGIYLYLGNGNIFESESHPPLKQDVENVDKTLLSNIEHNNSNQNNSLNPTKIQLSTNKDALDFDDAEIERQWLDNTTDVPVSNYLEKLIQSYKNGEPNATYHLSYVHRLCSGVPERENQLLKVIDKEVNPGVNANYIDEYIFCENFPRDMFTMLDVRDMIMMSARNGSVKAKLEFASVAFDFGILSETVKNAELIVQLKNESMMHYKDAMRMGEPSSLFYLALAYQNGDLIDSDLIESYAFYKAYQIVNPVFINPAFDNLINDLTNKQVDLAEKRGKIYAKCCA